MKYRVLGQLLGRILAIGFIFTILLNQEIFASEPINLNQNLGKLPIFFVENKGQLDPSYSHYAHSAKYQFFFSKEGATYLFPGKKTRIQVAFEGSNPNPIIEGVEKKDGKINYLVGRDSSQWKTGMSTYGALVYRDIYPNIDYVMKGKTDSLEMEFYVRPGGDAKKIRLNYKQGVKSLKISEDGSLLIQSKNGNLIEKKPYVYQNIKGKRIEVASRYWVKDKEYGFTIGEYDSKAELVIDPALVFSTYLGGAEEDTIIGLAVDSTGIYTMGHTNGGSSSAGPFPTSTGAYDTTYNGDGDVFITKLNADGSSLIYSTFLGSSGDDDIPVAFNVNSSGEVYITGTTTSSSFPTTSGAYDTTGNGDSDVFITKLSADGSSLTYSTFLGGSDPETVSSLIVRNGYVYVAGTTSSSNFPTTSKAYDRTYNGDGDVFTTRLSTDGSSLAYSTFLGGSDPETFSALVVQSGVVYLAGFTYSSDFPTTSGAYDEVYEDNGDAFIMRFNLR